MLKDYYKILEVDYDATEELIRFNYRKLALVRLSFRVFLDQKKDFFFFFLLWLRMFFVVPFYRSGILISTKEIVQLQKNL